MNPFVKPDKEQLFAIDSTITSLFYQESDNTLFAATEKGDIVRISFSNRKVETLWHGAPKYYKQFKILPAGDHAACLSLRNDTDRKKYLLSLIFGIDREKVISAGYIHDVAISSDKKKICIVGNDSIKIFRDKGSEWICLFERNSPFNLFESKVAFMGNNDLLVVILEGGKWLEVWELADGLPTLGVIDLPQKGISLQAKGNNIVVGCQSGSLLSLSFKWTFIKKEEIKNEVL